MTDAVLAVNAGSSSVKFALFAATPGLPRTVSGELEGMGASPRFHARAADGTVLAERRAEGMGPVDVLAWAEGHLGADRLAAVSHRVVHGGRTFVAPVLVDDAVLDGLDRLTPLAPLHQPPALAAIRAVRSHRPDLPQVACFDTAFHRSHAPAVDRFALPRELEEEAGVLRYGFHGLSYEHVAAELRARDPALAAGRVVVAHLGNGASLCAMADGRGVDTTMSFTPLDGLVMGTRPGALDPGVVLYLLTERGMSVAAVADMLWHRSGLRGVSGIGSDMRTLLASADPRAAEAVDLFVHRAVKETGGLVAVLGGLDGLVFTGGIGEHAAPIRARICERLGWLGLVLDEGANARAAARISAPGSRVAVLVMPTDEERVLARHAMALVG